MRISHPSRERGEQILEFAMIFPLLYLLLMGIFDLGRFVYYDSVLYNAAREGARYGVITPADGVITPAYSAGIETAVRNLAIGLDPGLLTVNSTYNSSTGTIQVTLTYEFSAVTPLIGALFATDPVIITAQSTMRTEG